MPNKDRYIEVREQGPKGKILHRGPDRRYYSSDYKIRCALGIPIGDWIKYATVIGTLITLIYNGGHFYDKLNDLGSGQDKISAKQDYLLEWTQNNDKWNERFFDTEFKDGKPVNPKFMARRFK